LCWLGKKPNQLFILMTKGRNHFLTETVARSLSRNKDFDDLTHLRCAQLSTAGVEITTRQLAKCEWNLELASNFFNLLASLASVFPLLSVSLLSSLIESYSSPIPKCKQTPDTVIYLLL
jgi:hypothetical protein